MTSFKRYASALAVKRYVEDIVARTKLMPTSSSIPAETRAEKSKLDYILSKVKKESEKYKLDRH